MAVIRTTEIMTMDMVMTVMEEIEEEGDVLVISTRISHSIVFIQSIHRTIHRTIPIHTITDHITDLMATNISKVYNFQIR
ncbi:hypothetical protein CD33_14595 [Ureibacillus sinduriensis BLB-1 = JCM 15800]|uniref:Uncharacterized protein n=1 Tax=Ureibacillus sinduriensis BLB-1 = JCM 15800 TaxID=1384057 RepID=A0A0A3HX66_9BACL|nr:hypothetical protein CD33_14595 [Ureibacillus sinduriensis BLB-1 = JCM 15800]